MKKRIVFIASHLGYPMDRTPLGGGAMVGLQLARHWAGRGDFELETIGSGPQAPDKRVNYHQVAPEEPAIERLSEFGYARFCGEFGRGAIDLLERNRRDWKPEETCVLLNDISEAPDMRRIAELGYPMVSIWHVDVVDFFNKVYLRELLEPRRFTRAYAAIATAKLSWAVPKLLRLIFEKQQQTVAYSRRLVLPSKGMAETVRSCYRHVRPELNGRIVILPWGGWGRGLGETADPQSRPDDDGRGNGAIAHGPEMADRLKKHYQIEDDTRVLITLSRISPEKGLTLLLEALRLLESRKTAPSDVCLLLCGEPAFMRGESCRRAVLKAARRLKRFRVFFPGYLSDADKRAYLQLAQLFVSPSIHESYGLSIVEALQAGLPVLASDHSGVDEILSPEFSRIVAYRPGFGGLNRARAAGDLSTALEDLLKDPARLKAMGNQARKAAKRMPFSATADRLAKVVLDCL